MNIMFRRISSLSIALSAMLRLSAQGQLEIHYIDVGQADCALLKSPNGETVLFDSGGADDEDKEKSLAYLHELGITKVDYLITSHYHADHIGSVPTLFGEIAISKAAYDRGDPVSQTNVYKAYARTLGQHRKTVTAGTKLVLDGGTAHPVRIDFVALNANGIPSSDENDQSIVAVVHYGDFDAEFGGDLSGKNHKTYHNIETAVAARVGQVEVYKVHHHGSSHSTNADWLKVVRPKIGIVSCGSRNVYSHPTAETMDALHAAGIRTYWTENGTGADPDPEMDVVGGSILVQVNPSGNDFTVTYGNQKTDHYWCWDHEPAAGATSTAGTSAAPTEPFVWSKKSKTYHHAECAYCDSIRVENRMSGPTPPTGYTLHRNCPK